MSSRQTRRLERRSERQARQVGSTPRPARARAARTPVRVRGGSSIPWQPIGIAAGIILIGAILVFAFLQSTATSTNSTPDFLKAELDSSTSLPGTYVQPDPGPDGVVCSQVSCLSTMDDRNHVTATIPICSADQLAANDIGNCYNSNPPTSGNHNPQPAAFKIYDNPVPKENLVHSMEHGAVIVWYNTDNQDVINQLKSVVQSELDRRKQVVMSKYTEMEPDTIALTAWTRLDKFSVSDFNKDRVKTFIEKLSKHFNPENF
jgi:hypothetical protein